MRWLVIRLIFVVLFCFVLPFPSLLSRCLDSVERNVIYWLYFSSLEFMIQKAVKSFRRILGTMIPYAALFTFPRGVRYYYEIIHLFIYLLFRAWICEGKLNEQNNSTQQKALRVSDNDFDIGSGYRKNQERV